MEAQTAFISFFITNYIIEFMQMTVVLCSIDSKRHSLLRQPATMPSVWKISD